MIRTASTVLVVWVLGFAYVQPQAQSAVPQKSYVWSGELLVVDETSRNATVKVPVQDHVARYVNRFKPGDALLVLWDMVATTQGDHIRALWQYDEAAKLMPAGYILPMTFVSADVSAKTVTFTVRVPAATLAVLKTVKPGQRIDVTAPIDQPSREAAITSIRVADQPKSDAIAR